MEITHNANLPGTSAVTPEQQNKLSDEQNQSDDKQQKDDTVAISSAAQSLFSATDVNNNANIKTREQAEQTVQKIQSSFQTNPEQAASAQANGAAELVSSFLS